ncbi:MAG TPA: metalloregulator ArsR/SmtB family transcription factor [Caulobacterales bacterium]|nr:metalloregulator ArsR/SmtB family transcription factor [Caulobacterales bacterium]
MTPQADVSQLMRALGDPTRRAVYERIAECGEATVSALVEGVDVSQPAVSQHLKALRAAGLVSERREGRFVRYSAEPKALEPLIDWLGYYGSFWRKRFANLEKLMKEIDP